MSSKAQFFIGVSVAVLAATGLLALAVQESEGGPGWQIPAVIGLVLLVSVVFLLMKNRKGRR
ncbi:hypothetical protein [Streptomyces sp. NPDC018972]|jgi:hypothetical protein|uniref:hypothetical protein n=1 Tax=Streptomyces sp. NPDC018972 TaxID=3365060 RepID=UPI0037A8CD6B